MWVTEGTLRHWEHVRPEVDEANADRDAWRRWGQYEWHWLQTLKREKAELLARRAKALEDWRNGTYKPATDNDPWKVTT